jgi:hypothetical protein
MMARDCCQRRTNPWQDLLDVQRKKLRGGTWRYVTENLDYPYHMLRDRLARAETRSLDDVPRGEGRIVRVNGHRVAAYRDERGALTVLSPICSHLGCMVRWNEAESPLTKPSRS